MAEFVAKPIPDDVLPECCRTGFLFTGTPSGTFTRIGDIDTYVSKGAECCSKGKEDKAIVLFTDVFGHTFKNSQLVADSYAQGTGVTVYVPDLTEGEAIDFASLATVKDPMKEIFGPWLGRNGDAKVIPIVDKFLAALRSTAQVKKIAGIGFCWGARYTVLAAVAGKLEYLAIAHPSRIDVPKIFEDVRVPSLFLCAEVDTQFPYPTAIEATKEVYARNNVPHEFHVFLGTSHGFAIRGDENNEVHRKAKIDATAAAIKFFESHL